MCLYKIQGFDIYKEQFPRSMNFLWWLKFQVIIYVILEAFWSRNYK